MFYWLILGVLVVFIYKFYLVLKSLNHFNELGIKQSKPIPFLGDQWRIFMGKISFLDQFLWFYNMYPNTRYLGIYDFTGPALIIRDPELIKQLTIKDFDHFTDHRSLTAPEADPLFSGNLFLLKGHKWREMRATVSGTFTGSKLKNMFHLMNEAAESFIEFFKDKNQESIEIEMKDTFTRYTNDVIATTAFGIKVDSLREPNNVFYLMGKKATELNSFWNRMRVFALFLVPKLCQIFKLGVFTKDVSIFFAQIVSETIRTRVEQGIVRNDMINILLEGRKNGKNGNPNNKETTTSESNNIQNFQQKKYFSDLDITAQAIIFFFAGFDAVSRAMCFGCYELAVCKDIQDKLREEIKETYKINNGIITYDSLLKMKYMDMFLCETLRKWPPAINTDRVVTKKYIIEPKTAEETPVHLKPGDIIYIPVIGIHRDPKYYPNPEKFDPERFSEENKNKIIPGTYMPFGSGPRICIASRFASLEIKALFFRILLNFEIVPSEKTPIPLILKKSSFNTTAEGGFWFKLNRIIEI